MAESDNIIGQSRDLTVQSRARSDERSGFPLFLWLAGGASLIAPWWSPRRDIELRNFWKKSDHLGGAIYNMVAKMTAIPFKIVPRDQSDKANVREAEDETMRLMEAAEFGEGWPAFYSKFVEDLLSTDNGAFAEVIGAGRPDGPIIGKPVTIAHLDSLRCQRSGNPEFPVIYSDMDGRMYKLHFSRVIYTSQMTSPIAEMYGVGWCGVSRATNIAQTLIDILAYKQEKLGSRPHRAIMVTKGGLDPLDVKEAFRIAQMDMNAQGLSRYSKIAVVGNQAIPEAGLDMLDLASLPDGFDEESSIIFGMATIALALGVDARELFPAIGGGATRADALIQHIKQRGKGPGQIIQTTESQLNQKVLSSRLKMEFDFQDDAEDMQVAEIRHIRSQKRQRDLLTKSVTIRVAREQMLEAKEITRKQFEVMELEDGRLEDGTSVLALFFSQDKNISGFLQMNEVDNPLDMNDNDPEYILDEISRLTAEANKTLVNSSSDKEKWSATLALGALNKLKEEYEAEKTKDQFEQNEPEEEAVETTDGEAGNSRNFPTRRRNLAAPNVGREMSPNDKLTPGEDERNVVKDVQIGGNGRSYQ
jgi:hypothetical protein